MGQQVLSRTQRNDVFQLLLKHSLDPVEFQWLDTSTRATVRETVKHTPTGSFVEVSHHDGGFWITWWPGPTGAKVSETFPDWRTTLPTVRDWVAKVAQEHGAPDLWAEIAKQNALPEAAASTGYRTPFAADELQQLKTSLASIEHFITTNGRLDAASAQQIHERFAYLLDAAKITSRKIDWLNIFVGQMIGLVTAGLLDPKLYGSVMAHAATTLTSVFHFGIKLLVN